MGSTKILVFRLKEIIYTVLFIALGVLLILLLVFMFSKKEKSTPTLEYVPGVYSSSVLLDNQPINVEVIVDRNHINSVKLIDLNTTTETLFPLLEEAMSNIETQLTSDATVDTLEIKSEFKYTSALLLEAINGALSKASVEAVHK
ncbi:MAG: hypothetical protein CVU84_05425 [Firmicutes bacterium HGW-Firmicutes-1]|jgi:uncharacterized protein with FMN-binding domain|nr:MAG: hypothetical protein CVU84_05425 [Firmicutes bacterium HGW-Firmicutes-1]